MPRRPIPGSLIWLAALVALAIATAATGGVILYLEAKRATRIQAEAITGGSVDRGEAALVRYGCGGCHVISGIAGANGKVGPDLSQVAECAEISGRLPNDPMSIVRWIMHPQAFEPGTGMPDQGVTERDARDIAAYLYSNE